MFSSNSFNVCPQCGKANALSARYCSSCGKQLVVPEEVVVCPKCHKTIIDEMLGQVVDPEMEFDAIREAMMDDDPTRDFIGMPLRDFLRSGMYLQTQNVFFVDKLGFPINDYMPCMGARVLTIEKQDTQGKTKVTLNYDPDLPAE